MRLRFLSSLRFKIKDLFSLSDGLLWTLVCACCLYGFVLIASATHSFDSYKNLIIQIGAFVVGVIGILVIMAIDTENLSVLAKYLYILGILLLIATLIFGTDRFGNKNWIIIGPLSVQPSEFVKLIFIITFATHLKAVHNFINTPRALIPLLLHAGLLMGLVLMQGDMGTALVYLFIFIMMMAAAGLHWLYFLISGVVSVAAAPFIFEYLLKDYQKLRILAVYDPGIDPLGYGYQTLQSQTTLGSGGVFGSGLFKGVQTQYSILPAKQTDFIFAVAGEELGFFGVFIIIVLLVALLIRVLYIAKNATDDFGSYVAMGVAAMLFFQIAENIGMCIGIFPIIGITLPFFSYGGSSMLASMLAMGIVMSVNSKRKIIGIFQSGRGDSRSYLDF